LILLSILSCYGTGFSNIISNIDKKEIELTTRFDGSNLLVFGALPQTKNKPYLIIEIVGPNEDITIRKKSRVWGIWVNKDFAKFKNIPSFYQINAKNLDSDTESKIKNKKLDAYFFSRLFRPNDSYDQTQEEEYFDELIRLSQSSENLSLFENEINILEKKLFFSTIKLPQKISPGDYRVIISLLDKNYKVINVSEQKVKVKKIGIQEFLSFNAKNNSTFYGIFSVIIALFLGFAAAQIFRLLKI
tara:strand:+ start:87 stop:821 length:735 start_codon:yes stop_codon:yes gene_type:complete